jgi:hypothetical protein
MYEDLVEAIRRRGAILFVGAGVSKNVGVPTTAEIVNEIARQLDYDPVQSSVRWRTTARWPSSMSSTRAPSARCGVGWT